VIQSELKGRAFKVGTVLFDLRKAADKQGPDIPDSAYLELFDSQLRKAFAGAALAKGTMLAYPVNVAIEELILRSASFPSDETSTIRVPENSTFRVRMEIVSDNGAILLRGHLRSFIAGPSYWTSTGNTVFPVARPAEGWEYVALAKMCPAVALVIAATTQGLQQGKTLDEIRIFPHDMDAGNSISGPVTVIAADLFLENARFGMTEMDQKEIARVIQAAQAGSKRQGGASDSTGSLERRQ